MPGPLRGVRAGRPRDPRLPGDQEAPQEPEQPREHGAATASSSGARAGLEPTAEQADPSATDGIAASSVACERYPEKCSRAVTSTTPRVDDQRPTTSTGPPPWTKPHDDAMSPTKIASSETGTPPNGLGAAPPRSQHAAGRARPLGLDP